MKEKTVIQLSVQSTGVAVAFGVNGSGLITDGTGEGVTTSLSVCEWIMPGANALSGIIYLPPGKTSTDDAKVSAKILRTDEWGEPVAGAEPLAVFEWAASASARYPLPVTIAFESAEESPASLWKDAEAVKKLSDSDKKDILEQVDGFRLAMMSGDAGRAFELSASKYKDMVAIYKATPEAYKKALERQVKFIAQAPEKPKKLELEHAAFALIAGGRVVMVSAGNRPAITLSTEDFDIEISVYCAKIDGSWVICR